MCAGGTVHTEQKVCGISAADKKKNKSSVNNKDRALAEK